MELFDTHFHYYAEDCEPMEYISRARKSGVRYLLAVGASLEESRLARSFSGKTSECWFSAGLHPHEASSHPEGIAVFSEFIGDPRLAAVGEVGLDYFYENSNRKVQMKVFEEFIRMALENSLPLIVHCRDKAGSEEAYSDSFPVLREYSNSGGRFVLHCFTGTNEWCIKFLELGAFVSVGGIVTFPKAENVRELLKVIPDDRLLLETDSPYLAPAPHRGSRNHPEYLAVIARYVAGLKSLPTESVVELTTRNAFSLFRTGGV